MAFLDGAMLEPSLREDCQPLHANLVVGVGETAKLGEVMQSLFLAAFGCKPPWREG